MSGPSYELSGVIFMSGDVSIIEVQLGKGAERILLVRTGKGARWLMGSWWLQFLASR